MVLHRPEVVDIGVLESIPKCLHNVHAEYLKKI